MLPAGFMYYFQCIFCCVLGPLEACVAFDQKVNEQLPPSAEETCQTAIDDSKLKEENIIESSSVLESQDTPEAPVTGIVKPLF